MENWTGLYWIDLVVLKVIIMPTTRFTYM